ncbi:MAG: hypothetical protein V8S08_11985 [Lachnoclostridium sp.]
MQKTVELEIDSTSGKGLRNDILKYPKGAGEIKMAKLKVMLVDDEPFIRQGMRILIDWKSYGYEIAAEKRRMECRLWKC